jgi:hypothetical protein
LLEDQNVGYTSKNIFLASGEALCVLGFHSFFFFGKMTGGTKDTKL